MRRDDNDYDDEGDTDTEDDDNDNDDDHDDDEEHILCHRPFSQKWLADFSEVGGRKVNATHVKQRGTDSDIVVRLFGTCAVDCKQSMIVNKLIDHTA